MIEFKDTLKILLQNFHHFDQSGSALILGKLVLRVNVTAV